MNSTHHTLRFLGLACTLAWVASCGSDDGNEDAADDTMDDALDDVTDDALDDVEEDVDVEPDGPPGILDCDLEDRTFWTWDLAVMPPSDTQVTASCRGWGEHVAVYVPDDIWLTSISGDDVVTIVETFEDATPADDARGIYDITTAAFGEPPDVDGEPRIVLLYMEMGSFMGTEFDGFFRAQDEAAGSYSNLTEMVHLNGVRLPTGQPYMLSIVAHEFQHLLHYRADPDEHPWINESMSEAAMALCGYYTDEGNVGAFAASPDVSLVTIDRVDYGASFLFGVYLIEQLGEAFLLDLVSESANGITGFDSASSSYSVDFLTVFSDWTIANFMDDPALDAGQWGYADYDPPSMADTTSAPDGVLRSGTLNGWAADYLHYPLSTTGTDLVVHIESTDWASLGATLITRSTSGGTPTLTPISILASPTEETITVPDGDDEAILVLTALAEGSFSYEHSALW
ncbi:MAG: hypothetical protein JRG91_10995 [Deltaproteobacteria bacterium]|nr:hypothetical protein [Deltaproteobacteria bacterium]